MVKYGLCPAVDNDWSPNHRNWRDVGELELAGAPADIETMLGIRR